MHNTQPKARLMVRPQVEWDAIWEELSDEGYGAQWWHSRKGTPQDYAEFAGRMCYRAWEDTNNLNISRVRSDQEAYFANLIKQGHTSVFEHLNWSFVLTGSRVLTHELIRHRPGTAVSQESGRYVRLHNDDMGWVDVPAGTIPEAVISAAGGLRERYMRDMQQLSDTLPWDEMNFSEKKQITSWLRRSFPEGRSTRLVWSANARILRHVIGLRTSPGAELEIRLLFGQIADIMAVEAPLLFQDMQVEVLEDGTSAYTFGE